MERGVHAGVASGAPPPPPAPPPQNGAAPHNGKQQHTRTRTRALGVLQSELAQAATPLAALCIFLDAKQYQLVEVCQN
jgi:hypothetical protein